MFSTDLTPEQKKVIDMLKVKQPELATIYEQQFKADNKATMMAHFDTVIGDDQLSIPTGKRGRAQFAPKVAQDFALDPFISKAPQSLGGKTMVPINEKLLYPWRSDPEMQGIERRSPWWDLMGYSR
jgi:hypothetical protein